MFYSILLFEGFMKWEERIERENDLEKNLLAWILILQDFLCKYVFYSDKPWNLFHSTKNVLGVGKFSVLWFKTVSISVVVAYLFWVQKIEEQNDRCYRAVWSSVAEGYTMVNIIYPGRNPVFILFHFSGLLSTSYIVQ